MWIIYPLVFLAGFVDSIAGGGGLISLTSFLAIGLPSHLALGTNKFSAVTGTGISAARFVKKGHVEWKTAGMAIVGGFVGSTIGSRLALLVDERILSIIMIIVVPVVAIFLLFNKGFGKEEKEKNLPSSKALMISLAIGLVIGAYDGFFGPGTGTFLIMSFTAILGLPLLTACGNTKLVNFATNIAAVISFMVSGNVVYKIAIPCAFCSILGNYIGSELAMKKGLRIVKPMMLVVIGILIIKILFDLFTKKL